MFCGRRGKKTEPEEDRIFKPPVSPHFQAGAENGSLSRRGPSRRRLLGLRKSPRLHPPLELPPGGSRVPLDSMLAQQAIFGLEQALAHRVEMHVIASRPQVAVAAALDQLRLVASTENMPEKLVAAVEPEGAGALQPRHARDQVRVGGLQHQMVVLAHEAIGMHPPPGYSTRSLRGMAH